MIPIVKNNVKNIYTISGQPVRISQKDFISLKQTVAELTKDDKFLAKVSLVNACQLREYTLDKILQQEKNTKIQEITTPKKTEKAIQAIKSYVSRYKQEKGKGLER